MEDGSSLLLREGWPFCDGTRRQFVDSPLGDNGEHFAPVGLHDVGSVTKFSFKHCVNEALGVWWRVRKDGLAVPWSEAVAQAGAQFSESQFRP
jgi:hypothetical protein